MFQTPRVQDSWWTFRVFELVDYSQRTQLVLHLLPLSGASLHVADSRYFWFHHTEGDTMTVQDPGEMNLCSALWAVVAYVVADLEDMLPR